MNLIIIVADTLRWDYVGAYGNDWIRTPNLDALAAESALFLDAYAEGLPTINARRVIYTGRNIIPMEYRPQASDPIQQHGWHPLYDEDVTLAEHLQARGYHTALFNDVYHLMKPGKNFHRGFAQWFWIRGQEADAYALPDAGPVRDLLRRAAGGREVSDDSWVVRHMALRSRWQSDADTLVGQTLGRAADWVRSYTLEKPFYLHVECFDPHEPWDPPADYARTYEPDYGESLDGCIAPGSVERCSDRQLANIRAAYAGEVTLVDRWVGHLLDAVREAGRMDDTVVIFTSDHGCMMGEQGQIHKGTDRIRNQVSRLPLLVRHPAGEAAGAHVPGFCQHQDIMPTALGLLGEPVPERVLGRDVWPQATSCVAQALQPETGRPAPRASSQWSGSATEHERLAVACNRAPDSVASVPEAIVSAFCFHASIRTAEWNYIRPWIRPSEDEVSTWRLYGIRSDREELYDLKADPEELTDVAAEHPEVCRELAARLDAHIRQMAPLTSGTIGAIEQLGPAMTFDGLPPLL